MKISTSLDHAIKIDKVSSRESARIMKKVGFEGIDLALCHDMSDPANVLAPHWADRVFEDAEAARAEGLEIAQCHLPYECPQDTVHEYAEVWTEALIHSIKIAHDAGAKIAVIHPATCLGDPEATHRENVEFFRTFVPYLEKYDMQLAVENVFIRRNAKNMESYVGSAPELMAIINEVNCERIGICLDTGHANIYRHKPGEMVREFGKKLLALHVNSNCSTIDEHLIPGIILPWCEKMKYDDFYVALKEIEFPGFFNMEISSTVLPKGCAEAYLHIAAAVARQMADQVR